MGAFEEASISEFLDSVLLGKKTYACTLPAIADQSKEPAKKPRVPPTEEELAAAEKDEL